MSSLIFYTDPEQVLVVTDTLAVNPDGSPLLFTSKAHYLPRLKTIVAGTGLAGFSVEWAMSANNRMAVTGVENLNYQAPKRLGELWAGYKKDSQMPSDLTTTVYHFGISEGSGEVAAFAYRSTADFRSERLGFGIGVKPECTLPEIDLEHLPPNGGPWWFRRHRPRRPPRPGLCPAGPLRPTRTARLGWSA